MKNQKGFSSVAIILILVVVQIIGSSCQYVFKVRQDAEKKLDNTNTVSESRAGQAVSQNAQVLETDETAGWKSYVSAEGRFSLRYPKNWVVGSRFHDELCPEIFLAAPDAELLGRCATEPFGFGQISVTFTKGNHLHDSRLTAYYPYQNITRRKVMVNNTEGLRESGTAKGHSDEKFDLEGLPDGTKVVIYSFYVHGRTYVAQYIQRRSDPNVLREFDLMIAKTLKFSGWTLSAKGEVEAANRRTAQDEKPAVVPVQIENEADAPLVITEAAAEISAPYEITLKGTRGDGQEVTLINKGEKARRIKFTLKMVNRSNHTIIQCIVRLLNTAFLSDESILVGSRLWVRNPGWPLEIEPQETFTVTTDLPLADRRNGQELANHLSGFRVKVAETTFKPAESQEWIEGGNFSNLYGRVEDMVMVIDCADGTVFRLVKKRPISEPPPTQTSGKLEPKGILVSTESCGPQIEYKQPLPLEMGRRAPNGLLTSGGKDSETPLIFYYEKAKYTEDARQNNTQGMVLLHVTFNANGRITDIRVMAGLPNVLTEKAIEAALKIRFQPAVRGGVPISVRRPLLFSFTLY